MTKENIFQKGSITLYSTGEEYSFGSFRAFPLDNLFILDYIGGWNEARDTTAGRSIGCPRHRLLAISLEETLMPQLAPSPTPTVAPEGGSPAVAQTPSQTPDASGGLNTTAMPNISDQGGVSPQQARNMEILIQKPTHNDKGWAFKGLLEEKKQLVMSGTLTTEQLTTLAEVTFNERIADEKLQKQMPDLIAKAKAGDPEAAKQLSDILVKTFEDRKHTSPQYYIAKKEGYSTSTWTNTTLSSVSENVARLVGGPATGYVVREGGVLSSNSSVTMDDADRDGFKKRELDEETSGGAKGPKNLHTGYAETSQKFAEGVKRAEAERHRIDAVDFEEQEKRNREKSQEYARKFQGELKLVDVRNLADVPGEDLDILIEGNAEREVSKIRARRGEERQIALSPELLDRNQNGLMDDREVPVVDQSIKPDEKRENVNLKDEEKRNKKPPTQPA